MPVGNTMNLHHRICQGFRLFNVASSKHPFNILLLPHALFDKA